MTIGTIETKGTRLYFAVDATTIERVACPTGITGLGGAADQIETTCLDSVEREYKQGFRNPGPVTVPINFIPQSSSHQALLDLAESGDTISWMIVLSDQTGSPTAVDSDDRLVSPGPTTIEFLGYVADFNLDVSTNEIVRATLTIQRSGAAAYDLPAAIYD